MIQGKGSALLSQGVGSRIEFARVVGADFSYGCPDPGTCASREALKNGCHNVVAFDSTDIWGENTLAASSA